MDDKHIVQMYLDRNEEAIAATQKKYAGLCFGIAKHILGNEPDAEECLNDTYLATWNAIPPAEPRSLMAFVAKIARNLSLKRLEYNNAQKRAGMTPVEFSELAEVLADDSALQEESDEALGHIISDFLRSEKADARNVFVRKYWYFDSIEEIATRYGFTQSKVKSMLHQTRSRLKHYLNIKGVNV